MANFKAMTLTKAGRNVLAAGQTGAPIMFVRVKAGDGILPPDASIADMTDVINWITDLPINSNTVTGDGMTEIECILSNQNLETGYWFREIGLFALDAEGNEVLYAYSNAGDEPDYIPAGGGAHAVNIVFTLITVVDQAENVTAVISENLGFVTFPRLAEELDKLFAPYVTANGFWTFSAQEKKLRPASVAESLKTLFRSASGISPLFITWNPVSQTIGFLPMHRVTIKAERLNGGTPVLPLDQYDGRLYGGTPVLALDQYDGRLYGGDPQTI
jgi:hypothetical protein